MTLTSSENDKNIKSLVSLGAKGIFPLFNNDWISEISTLKKQELTGEDHLRNNTIFKNINKHSGLERKKTVLLALSADERRKFVIGFMSKVEDKIMKDKPEIQ